MGKFTYTHYNQLPILVIMNILAKYFYVRRPFERLNGKNIIFRICARYEIKMRAREKSH